MAQIFISYRRSDTAYVAATLNDKLQQHFGPDSVFFDVDNIPLGVDFRHYIENAVGQCDVLLVVIGDQWSGATDVSGKRRIDNPSDFVRVEIEAALKRNIPIIPVLVGEAKMPPSTELPASIERIAFRNPAEIRAGRDLRQHIEHLIRGLERIFATSASSKPAEADQESVPESINASSEDSDDVLPFQPAVQKTPAGGKETMLNFIEEGMVLEGRIKTLTDYGAFVDVGGVDGLLHLTDMSWGHLQHAGDLFRVGDYLQVKVLKFDRERERISLGYKQLLPDPWLTVEERFPVGTRVLGKIAAVTDYGAFVELENGIEGLVHVSEMTWSKRVPHPSELVNPGDEVEVEVLSVDAKARRISLGMKHLQDNPWQTILERYQIGTRVHGRVRNLTDFGAFIEIEDGVDGLVHVSDISWSRRIKHPSEVLKKGQDVEAIITSVDVENRRLSLSIKDLEPNAWDRFVTEHKPGDVVRGKISRLANFGVFVELDDNLEGLCHVSELSEQPAEKPEDVVHVGQEMEFKILRIDAESKKIGLSARAVAWDTGG